MRTIISTLLTTSLLLCVCGCGAKSETDMTKTIEVPCIEGLESLSSTEFQAVMDRDAASGKVDRINWPDQYPYCPECDFRIARSGSVLALSFLVTGRDLRATEMEDGGRSWEDSCCEFFIAPGDGYYYNIETTCIGSILMARGKDRYEREKFALEQTARIVRRSSLEHKPYDIEGGEHSWRLDLLIPLDLIGLDPLPPYAEANLYKCGDCTATPHYVSWAPIATQKPDFHRPEYFGKIIFK